MLNSLYSIEFLSSISTVKEPVKLCNTKSALSFTEMIDGRLEMLDMPTAAKRAEITP